MILFKIFVAFLSSFEVVYLFKKEDFKFIIDRSNFLKFLSFLNQILNCVISDWIHEGHKLFFVIIFDIDGARSLLQHSSEVCIVFRGQIFSNELFVNNIIETLDSVNIIGSGCYVLHFKEFLIDLFKFTFIRFKQNITSEFSFHHHIRFIQLL